MLKRAYKAWLQSAWPGARTIVMFYFYLYLTSHFERMYVLSQLFLSKEVAETNNYQQIILS